MLTEILRVDPAFDKERFLQQCESDIIPNVLEVGAPAAVLVLPHCSLLQDCLAKGVFSEQRPGFHLQRPEHPHSQPLSVTHLRKGARCTLPPLVLVRAALTFSGLTHGVCLPPMTESLLTSCFLYVL